MLTADPPKGEVISKREAARRLGVTGSAGYAAVCALIAGNEIPTYPMPSNGMAQGIDERGMRKLRPLVDAYLASKGR